MLRKARVFFNMKMNRFLERTSNRAEVGVLLRDKKNNEQQLSYANSLSSS